MFRRTKFPDAVFTVKLPAGTTDAKGELGFLHHCLSEFVSDARVQTQWGGFFAPLSRAFFQDGNGHYRVLFNNASNEHAVRGIVTQLGFEIVREDKPPTWRPVQLNPVTMTYKVGFNGRYKEFDLSVK